jgi:hypothetical protein
VVEMMCINTTLQKIHRNLESTMIAPLEKDTAGHAWNPRHFRPACQRKPGCRSSNEVSSARSNRSV